MAAIPHPNPEAKNASRVPGRIATIICGVIFGAALAVSGAHSPVSVIAQFQGTNYHLMIVYLIAAATSAISIYTVRLLGIANCKARSASSLNWFSKYDGNILGGLLQGIGIALTGSLLETLPVQIALGMPSSWSVGLGALLGGILYSGYFVGLQKALVRHPKLLSVYGRYGWKEGPAVAMFVAICLTARALANRLQPYEHAAPIVKLYGRLTIGAQAEDSWMKPYGDISFASPVAGGLLINAAQFACLVLMGSTIGTSMAYERLGQTWWWIWRYERRPNFTAIMFIAGTLAGAWALSKFIDIPTLQDTSYSPSGRDVLGGAYLVIGSRLAGGCTSGHAISGLGTLSVSSFITIASIVVAATLWVPVLDSKKLWKADVFAV